MGLREHARISALHKPMGWASGDGYHEDNLPLPSTDPSQKALPNF